MCFQRYSSAQKDTNVIVLIWTILWYLLMLPYLSLNHILNPSSHVVESGNDDSICFILNPSLSAIKSSLGNNELKQMSSKHNKPLHVHKWHTTKLPPDLFLQFQFLTHNLVRILLFLSEDILINNNIHSYLDQIIVVQKANRVVPHILCIISCFMLIFLHIFILLSPPLTLPLFLILY